MSRSMTRGPTVVAAVLGLTLSSTQATSSGILLGEAAPSLGEHVEWLKGEPADSFGHGSVYVLEFWATWCPPCFVEMPHLSELARRYADHGVTILGLAVGADVGQTPRSFLERHPDRMSYAVAQEATPGSLERLFLVDGEELVLPMTLIVDRRGRLAWRSDPAGSREDLDVALQAVVEGSHDLARLARLDRSREKARRLAEPKIAAARRARDRGAFAEASRLYGEAARLEASSFGAHAVDAFAMRVCAGQGELAVEEARRALDMSIIDSPGELARLERAILHLPESPARSFDLARRAVELANDRLGGSHPDFLFDAAKVELAAGNEERARVLQARAVSAAREQRWSESYVGFIGRPDALLLSMRNDARQWAGACDVR